MTSNWRQTAEWDWVWLGAGNVLHAVGELDNAATADADWYGDGSTECGRRGVMTIPGLFSRMGAYRCVRCCKATGMPEGQQSPKNEDACRPIAEARALHWKEQNEGEGNA
jgi:hypothetical protein